MIELILIALLLFGGVGCSSAPILAKNCVKAEGTELYVCKKY